jgi:hypothetical protein
MPVYLQWQEKKAPRDFSSRGRELHRQVLYCRVVIAMTPPMLPVPNFVVASHER